MVNKVTVEENLESLAALLESSDANAAARLRSLRQAVSGGPLSEVWAGVDVQRVIDAETIAERYKGQHRKGGFISTLEWLRNVLIFAPLVVTWYSISQAVSKYNELIQLLVAQKSEQSALPFLYLWQQQFTLPGINITPLPSWLTLSSLAFTDFVLLSVVLLLTIVVSWAPNLSGSKQEQQAEQLRVDITDAVANASFCLIALRQQQQPVDFADVAREVIQQLSEERKRISDLASRREKELGDLAAFTTGLERVSSEMLEAANAIRDTNSELLRSINKLTGPMQDTAEQQKQLVQMVQEAGHHLQALPKTVTEQMQAVATAMTSQLRSVSKTLIEQYQQGNKTVTEQMQEVNRSLIGLVTKQEEWGETFKKAQERLDLLVATIGDSVSKIGVFATGQDEFLRELSKEREAQANIAVQVSRATVSLGDLMVQLKDCETSLRGISADMTHISNLYGGLPDRMHATLNGTLTDYSKAGVALRNSADALKDVSLGLKRLVP